MSSSRQLVQGAPCSTTLHLTLRARQHWQALEALLLTALAGLPLVVFNPAVEALRLEVCSELGSPFVRGVGLMSDMMAVLLP